MLVTLPNSKVNKDFHIKLYFPIAVQNALLRRRHRNDPRPARRPPQPHCRQLRHLHRLQTHVDWSWVRLRKGELKKKFKYLYTHLVSTFFSLPNFQLEKRGTDGRVALITLNRPESLNALSGPLVADLVSFKTHSTVSP